MGQNVLTRGLTCQRYNALHMPTYKRLVVYIHMLLLKRLNEFSIDHYAVLIVYHSI